MRSGWAGMVLAAVLLAAGSAAAEDSVCEAGKDGAKLSRVGTGDFIMDLMLGSTLSEPMKAGSVKLSQVKKLPRTCDRGDFLAGKSRYRAFGQAPGKKGLPIRYALPEDGKGPIAYLVPVAKDGDWILAVTDGDEMLALARVSAVPNDNDLRLIFGRALDGRYARSFGLNLKTGGTTQYVNADDLKAPAEKGPPTSSPDMPKPAPGQTPGGGVQQLTAPDGVVFKPVDGGGWAHAATGFICPPAVGAFQRDRAIIFDAADNGRDVGCRLVGEKSWMTVYLTKTPGRYSATDVFATYSEQARGAAPPKSDIDPPWMWPKSPNPSYADFWIGPKNMREGLWVIEIGPWYVKMRVTYAAEDEAAIAALAEAVATQVKAQVKAPEI